MLGDISLFDVLARKQLLFWAMKKFVESEINTDKWTWPTKTLYSSLPKALRIKSMDVRDKIFDDTTEKVKEFVLS